MALEDGYGVKGLISFYEHLQTPDIKYKQKRLASVIDLETADRIRWRRQHNVSQHRYRRSKSAITEERRSSERSKRHLTQGNQVTNEPTLEVFRQSFQGQRYAEVSKNGTGKEGRKENQRKDSSSYHLFPSENRENDPKPNVFTSVQHASTRRHSETAVKELDSSYLIEVSLPGSADTLENSFTESFHQTSDADIRKCSRSTSLPRESDARFIMSGSQILENMRGRSLPRPRIGPRPWRTSSPHPDNLMTSVVKPESQNVHYKHLTSSHHQSLEVSDVEREAPSMRTSIETSSPCVRQGRSRTRYISRKDSKSSNPSSKSNKATQSGEPVESQTPDVGFPPQGQTGYNTTESSRSPVSQCLPCVPKDENVATAFRRNTTRIRRSRPTKTSPTIQSRNEATDSYERQAFQEADKEKKLNTRTAANVEPNTERQGVQTNLPVKVMPQPLSTRTDEDKCSNDISQSRSKQIFPCIRSEDTVPESRNTVRNDQNEPPKLDPVMKHKSKKTHLTIEITPEPLSTRRDVESRSIDSGYGPSTTTKSLSETSFEFKNDDDKTVTEEKQSISQQPTASIIMENNGESIVNTAGTERNIPLSPLPVQQVYHVQHHHHHNITHITDSSGVQVNLPTSGEAVCKASERKTTGNQSVYNVAGSPTLERNTRDFTEEIMKREREDGVFVETKAYTAALNLLESLDGGVPIKNLVIITGYAGQGLTTLGRRILTSYCFDEFGKRTPKKAIIVHHPHQWDECINIKEPAVVLIEDMFRSLEVLEWTHTLPKIIEFVKGGQIKVIICIRKINLDEYNNMPTADITINFPDQLIVDLSSIEYALNINEKIKMLEAHIHKSRKVPRCQNINQIMEELGLEETFLSFPTYACKFAASTECVREGAPFFRRPLPFLVAEIDRILRSKIRAVRISFICLVLPFLSNYKLDVNAMPGYDEIAGSATKKTVLCASDKEIAKQNMVKVIDRVANGVDVQMLTKEDIQNGVSMLSGGLLRTNKETLFEFCDKAVQRAVEIAFGNIVPEYAIQYCDRNFIMDIVRPRNPNIEKEDVCTSSREYQYLFVDVSNSTVSCCLTDRLLNEGLKGEIKKFALHPLLAVQKFAEFCFQYISDKKLIQLMCQKDSYSGNSFLFYCLDQPTTVATLILNKSGWKTKRLPSAPIKRLWIKDQNRKSLLRACEVGNTAVYNYLKKMVDLSRNDQIECLYGACAAGNVDIVYDLMCSFQFMRHHLQEALKEACLGRSMKTKDEIRQRKLVLKKLIQTDKGVSANHSYPLIGHRTLLHEACARNKPDLVKTLLEIGANINCKSSPGMATPLHTAISLCNREVAECLLDSNASVYIKDKNGRLPIHVAAEKGSSYLTALLIGHHSPMNIKDSRGNTPMDIAEERKDQTLKDTLANSV